MPIIHIIWYVYTIRNMLLKTHFKGSKVLLCFSIKAKKTLKTSNRWGDPNGKSLKEFYFSKMYHRHIFLHKVYLPFFISLDKNQNQAGHPTRSTSRHPAYVIWKLYYIYRAHWAARWTQIGTIELDFHLVFLTDINRQFCHSETTWFFKVLVFVM